MATPPCRSSGTRIRPTLPRSPGSRRRSAGGTASEATLRSDYVLGQDEYGASTVLNLGGTRFPVPDQAVGRLVETAAEAKTPAGCLPGRHRACRTTLKTVTPDTSLVTGYEFLTDSSEAVRDQLRPGHRHVTPDTLINDTWTADDLRAKLLGGPKEDLVYLAGHFDASAALAADNQTTVTPASCWHRRSTSPTASCSARAAMPATARSTPTASPASPRRTGRRSLPARARRSSPGPASSTAMTSSSSTASAIYAEFAHQLRVGNGPVSVGQALVKSKLAYLAGDVAQGDAPEGAADRQRLRPADVRDRHAARAARAT